MTYLSGELFAIRRDLPRSQLSIASVVQIALLRNSEGSRSGAYRCRVRELKPTENINRDALPRSNEVVTAVKTRMVCRWSDVASSSRYIRR